MLTPWQQRSHRRFARHFQDLLDAAARMQHPHGINRWVTFERLSVYLRISVRVLEPVTSRSEFQSKLTRVVDIANVSTDEQYQGKGMFTRLVTKLHEMTDMPLYLENTHPEFANHLLSKHGWQIVNSYYGIMYNLVHHPTPVAQVPSADRADATGHQ